MPRRVFDFERPDRFIAGTIGMPGERTFYLQAVDGSRIASVALEKAQVALLAERLDDLLSEIGRDGDDLAPDDNDPLSVPLEEEFRVGSLALAWDPAQEAVVVEAHALGDEPADVGDDEVDSDAPDTLRVLVSPGEAAAFSRRARALVAAGRPPCPFCMQPLDAGGHICPRANGYRRRA